MSEIPTWYPGSNSRAAPMPLLRVQAFVNTRDLEEKTDLLSEPVGAREWMIEAGLLAPGAEMTASDLELARAVRESLRSLIELDGAEDGSGGLEVLRALAAEHRARLKVGGDGKVSLENAQAEDLGDALFGLLLIVHGAQQDESWSRLKICANDECRWAFYDRSRNRQGSWCSMASCGNRLKNRELRARRR